MTGFKALRLDRVDGQLRAELTELDEGALPPGDVTVAVAYSSLNYKDALAVTGRGPIVRNYPMVPGIDLAGTVEASGDVRFRPGDRVLLTGWGVGERHWGGLAQRARVKGDWLLPLPEGMDLQDAMAMGTAGLTAMLCTMTLEENGIVAGAPVLVTGATGGVGSLAIALLAGLGYEVVAVSGRPAFADYLHRLGARELLDRTALSSPKPLESGRWGAAVDVVGGELLADLLKSMHYGAPVAACGLAGGAELHTTVYPFILRSVKLIGVDSVMCPQPRRATAWERLAREMPRALLQGMTRVVPLAEVPAHCADLLDGRLHGRVVVDVNA